MEHQNWTAMVCRNVISEVDLVSPVEIQIVPSIILAHLSTHFAEHAKQTDT